MGFGFGILKLSAHDFWQMTLRELHVAIRPFEHEFEKPFQRATLEHLMAQHPDKDRSP